MEKYNYPCFDAENIVEIEKILGYTFRNKTLLLQAFIRRSFSNENASFENNEALEFIGDAVLGMIITQKLVRYFKREGSRWAEFYSLTPGVEFCRQNASFWEEEEEDGLPCFKTAGPWFETAKNEALLSELRRTIVQGKTLARATERAGLHKFLVMGQGDIKQNVEERSSVKEDLFEALLGAVVLDSNWHLDEVEAVIDRLLNPIDIIENGEEDGANPKLALVSLLTEERERLLSDPSLDAFCHYVSLTGCQEALGEEELPLISFVRSDAWLPFYFSCSKDFALGAPKKHFEALEKLRLTRDLIDRRNKIREAIGAINTKDAVSQVNTLVQKGIVPPVRFAIEKDGTAENGNPLWSARYMTGNEIEDSKQPRLSFAKQAEAKNAAALLFLLSAYALHPRDFINSTF